MNTRRIRHIQWYVSEEEVFEVMVQGSALDLLAPGVLVALGRKHDAVQIMRSKGSAEN